VGREYRLRGLLGSPILCPRLNVYIYFFSDVGAAVLGVDAAGFAPPAAAFEGAAAAAAAAWAVFLSGNADCASASEGGSCPLSADWQAEYVSYALVGFNPLMSCYVFSL